MPTTAPAAPVGDIDQTMSMIEKGQQLAGHFPDTEALDRAKRVLTGETTVADARNELASKYRQP